VQSDVGTVLQSEQFGDAEAAELLLALIEHRQTELRKQALDRLATAKELLCRMGGGCSALDNANSRGPRIRIMFNPFGSFGVASL